MEDNAHHMAGKSSGQIPTTSDVALTSIAISLKRIAHAMDEYVHIANGGWPTAARKT